MDLVRTCRKCGARFLARMGVGQCPNCEGWRTIPGSRTMMAPDLTDDERRALAFHILSSPTGLKREVEAQGVWLAAKSHYSEKIEKAEAERNEARKLAGGWTAQCESCERWSSNIMDGWCLSCSRKRVKELEEALRQARHLAIDRTDDGVAFCGSRQDIADLVEAHTGADAATTGPKQPPTTESE